jgi:hypothetical protein
MNRPRAGALWPAAPVTEFTAVKAMLNRIRESLLPAAFLSSGDMPMINECNLMTAPSGRASTNVAGGACESPVRSWR